MADTVVIMRDGNLEQIGSPLEVFERPVNHAERGQEPTAVDRHRSLTHGDL